jgi:ABC-2 type transport system permease protein/oleandomycin transport system permease protein
MSTATATAGTAPAPPLAQPRVVSDAITIAWRNVLNMTRNPQLLVFSTIQPVIFVLMFRYVFGGAIRGLRGVPYVDFLMPGVFLQTVLFGSMSTAIGLADDLNRGLIERFRSLPMARSAVLIGRTLADLLRNAFVVALMCAVGYAVDWRPSGSIPEIVAGLGIIFFFAYSLSWVFALVGMSVRDGETAQAVAFPILAPLLFASSAFVPLRTMPGWLQAFAEHQPVTIILEAVRGLTLGRPDSGDILSALAWIVGIIAVCAPLAVRRYRRVT